MTDYEILESKRFQQELATRVAVICAVVIALISLSLMAITLVSVARTAEKIADCTDVEGECYQRGKQQTAETVTSISDIIVAAATCATKLEKPTNEEVQTCVLSEIRKGKP